MTASGIPSVSHEIAFQTPSPRRAESNPPIVIAAIKTGTPKISPTVRKPWRALTSCCSTRFDPHPTLRAFQFLDRGIQSGARSSNEKIQSAGQYKDRRQIQQSPD